MIVVDTNVVLRYVVADERDPQTHIATHFLEETCSASGPAVLTPVVLAELVWTLDTRYGFSKADMLATIDTLLQNPNFAFDAEEEVLSALEAYRSSRAGLADCLIAARANALGTGPVVTFDTNAARSPGFLLLEAGA